MDNRQCRFLICLLIILAFHHPCSTKADLIVEYDGLAGTTQTPNSGTGIVGLLLSRGSGIDAAGGSTFNSRDFQAANLSDAILQDEYLGFGFSVSSGFRVSVDNIIVELDRSPQGPTDVFLLFDADQNGFDTGDLISTASIPNTGALLTFNSGLPSDLDSFSPDSEFRFYFSGAGNSAGTTDIEADLIGGASGNVGLQINGLIVAVPEPSTLAIALCVLGFAWHRRR